MKVEPYHSGNLVGAQGTTVNAKLANILVCPGEVFEEVVATPLRLVNWSLPTLLVCLAGTILLQMSGGQESATTVGTAATWETQMRAGVGPLVSSGAVCLSAIVGTCWSALVLWFIGRVFLKVHFSWLKALEVVGLTGIILVLGATVTGLLIIVSGDMNARPSLSLLVSRVPAQSTIHQLLDAVNLFHLWSTTVMAIGLSKLSGVSFKEAAFWVFGYWVLARLALIVLA